MVKHNRTVLAVMLAVLTVLSGMLPFPVSGVYAVSADHFRIYDVNARINGVPIDESEISGPFETEGSIFLSYAWEIDNNVEITEGEQLVVALPDVFDDAEIAGTLDGYGTWKVEGGNLTLTFSALGGGQSDVNGTVEFTMNYTLDTVRIDEPYTLVIPISGTESKTYRFDLTPPAGLPSVKKTGGTASGKQQWSIDFNQNLEANSPYSVLDTLDDRLLFDGGSVAVYQLEVYSDGSVVQGSALNPSQYEAVLDPEDAHAITFNVTSTSTTPSAYRIKYETTVDPDKLNTTQTSFTYTNTASFGGNSSQASVTVTGGSLIEKSNGNTTLSGTFNTDQIEWEIAVNEANYPLKSVIIEDTVPQGLNLDVDDVTVYDKDGVPTAPVSKTYDPGTKKLIVELGDISESYTIKYVTTLDETYLLSLTPSVDSKTYYELSFTNQAVLKQTQNGEEKSTQSGTTVKVKEGKQIYKTGSAGISYNEQKFMNWQLDINLGELATGATTVTDVLGTGMKFDASSLNLVIEPLSAGVTSSVSGAALTEGIDYTIALTDSSGGTNGYNDTMTVSFISGGGSAYNAETAYRLTYRSQLLDTSYDTQSSQSTFTNTGTFGGKSFSKTIQYIIKNTYIKSSTGFDYSEGAFGWKLEVKPTREAISNLVITEDFHTDMYMTAADFAGLSVQKVGDSTLTIGTDYTLTAITDPLDGGKIKGFILKFKDDAAVPVIDTVLNNATYLVTYKTHVNPDVLSENGDLSYTNKADWTSSDGSGSAGEITPNVNNNATYNGSKSGALDTDTKQLTWTIDLNYLSKNISGVLSEPFKVTDDIEHTVDPVDGEWSGQKLVSGSIQVIPYTLNAAGDILPGAPLDATQLSDAHITIDAAEDGGSFTVTFGGDMTTPYRIVYKTAMVGISETLYQNTASTNSGEDYYASVAYVQGDRFVTKTGARNGDFVDWSVKINESQSTINQIELIDTMSPGLILDETSFKLYESDGVTPADGSLDAAAAFSDKFSYEMLEKATPTSPQQFTISTKEGVIIEKTYIIKYESEISYDDIIDDAFTNSVSFIGEKVTEGTLESTKEIPHTILSGSGTGTGVVGGFKLTKVDENGDPVAGAQFKIERYSGDELRSVLGTMTTESDGTLTLDGLRYFTYKLTEIYAPLGYLLPTGDAAVTVIELNDTTTQNASVLAEATAVNHHQTLTLTKRDAENHALLLAGAIFEVFEDGISIGTFATDETGTAVVEGIKAGSRYEVVEKAAPVGYQRDVTSKIIDVTNQTQNQSLTFDNYTLRGLNIYKVDAEDGVTRLEGAVFEVENSSGVLVATLTTDDEGHAHLDDLPFDTYTIREISAPAGYVLDGTPQDVLVNQSNESFNVTFEDDAFRDLKLIKVDSDNPNLRLAGAVFELYDSNNVLISTVETDENGEAFINGLTFDTYKLVETKSPSGYVSIGMPMTITVDGEQAELVVTVRNQLRIKNSETNAPTTEGTTAEPTTEGTTDEGTTEVITEPTTAPESEELSTGTTTPKETPVEGETEVPEGGKPTIKTPPENGTVEIDDNGKWTYTPNEGFTGKDSFTVSILKPDGTEEELLVEIDVEDVPLGFGEGELPQTGESIPWLMYFGGMMLIALGGYLVAGKRKADSEK